LTPASRHVRRQLLGLAQLPAGAPVPSPCSNVCRIDGVTGLCDGCLRTLDEIREWRLLDDGGKLVVWARLGERAVADRARDST
jgi:predicted Fe-S protein YdhL (DUF1289 family)